MPYRRLPNTNQSRLRALQQLVQVGDEVMDLKDLAFSCKLLEDVRAMFVRYSRALAQYKQTAESQVSSNKKYQEDIKKARLYVSHFIQVLNMCVVREEIKPEMKELYKLDVASMAVPDLSSDDSLYEWGRNIVEGEQARLRHGGTPIYNPAISKVSVHYDIFAEGYNFQKVLQNNTSRAFDSVVSLNKEVDALILQVWNEVEASFMNLPIEDRVKKCQKYGVVYYYRRGEKKPMTAGV